MLDENILALIYQGPLEDEPWLQFLQTLRQQQNCIATVLHLRLPSPGVSSYDIAVSDWDVRITRDYYQSYYPLDPFDYSAMEPGKVYSWFDFVDEKTFRASTYYREFCQPLNYEYALCLCVEEPSGVRALVHLANTRERGNFTAKDLAYYRQLAPHLQRALTLLVKIHDSNSEKVAYKTAVDQMAIGTFLLDRDTAVINSNLVAKNLLQEHRFLSVRNKKLFLSDQQQQQKLKLAMNTMLDNPEPDHVEVCPVFSGEDELSFLFRHFPPAQINTNRQPAMLVYVTAPHAQHTPPQQLVAELFGLTPTEARLAILLAEGCSLVEAAEHMGVTESSIRTYSKRIFAKTGLSRQTELVRVILKSVAQLGLKESENLPASNN